MKYDCEVIRDLLPLYADRACSEHSRTMVEAHLSWTMAHGNSGVARQSSVPLFPDL